MVDSNFLEKNISIVNEVDKFIIIKDGNCISIQKSLSPQVKTEPFDSKYEKIGTPIEGILGVIEAKENNYLMTIDKSTFIGTFIKNKVFQIVDIVFYPFNTSENNKDDEFHLNQVRHFLKRNTFYYSSTIDLSISMIQIAKNSNSTPRTNDSLLFKNSQLNFVWNYSNTRILESELLIGIIHPVINGFIGIKPNDSYGVEFSFCLISRKDTRRSGCRFIVRGADSSGHVANFAETEQIIVVNDSKNNEYSILSYLQIRGSIPLIWNQLPNLQLNPPIVASNDYSAHSNAFNRHITQLISAYDKVTLVNLIDRKGDQNIIGEFYQSLYQNSKNLYQSNQSSGLESLVDFTWFDFHKECKNMKYENISKLLKSHSVSSSLNNHDFTQFSIKKGGSLSNIKVISIQKGVFRTNCIDNLDRTNVVQSVFARQFLHKMLFRLKLCEMPHGNTFEEFNSGFEANFKIFWGDNGDILSKAYSGTRALKRDFTRTGKRTTKGALEDGVNTCTRFYLNNFCDGYNQDCHDFYLGLLNPKKKNFKPHSTNLVNTLFLFTFFLSFFFYSMSIQLSFPQDHTTNFSKGILKLLVFAGVFLISSLSLFNGFKNSITDLSTIQYH